MAKRQKKPVDAPRESINAAQMHMHKDTFVIEQNVNAATLHEKQLCEQIERLDTQLKTAKRELRSTRDKLAGMSAVLGMRNSL